MMMTFLYRAPARITEAWQRWITEARVFTTGLRLERSYRRLLCELRAEDAGNHAARRLLAEALGGVDDALERHSRITSCNLAGAPAAAPVALVHDVDL